MSRMTWRSLAERCFLRLVYCESATADTLLSSYKAAHVEGSSLHL